MFFSYDDEKIRYTGRWGKEKNMITTTACGAYFEFAFSGEMVSLHFDTENQILPLPHLWISVDGGAKYECPVSPVVLLLLLSATSVQSLLSLTVHLTVSKWTTIK